MEDPSPDLGAGLDDFEDDESAAYSARDASGAFATVGRFVWPFLKKYRLGLLIVALGLGVETLFNVLVPLSLKYLIDDALGEKDLGALYVILGTLAAAGLVTSIVAVVYERWVARTSAAVIADVRAALFDRLQLLPTAFHSGSRRGAVLARFSVDMAALEAAVQQLAASGVLPLLELVAGFALLFWLNWQMALIALLIFPITLVGPRLLASRAVEANYRQKVDEAATLGVVQENIATQAVIKAFGLEGRAVGWFRRRNLAAQGSMATASFLSAMVERTVTISVLLLHLALLAIGAYLATNGDLSIGTFVTFESAFWEISYNVAHLMHFVPVTMQAAAATRHMGELIDESLVEQDRPDAVPLPLGAHQISFRDVQFRYPGQAIPALEQVSFEVEPGQHIAIVGTSGSGKSTLLSLMLRLFVPTGGSLAMDGIDLADVTRESLRSNLGVVFQESTLFSMTIRENIRLGKQGATDAEVVEAAGRAEIDGYIQSLPEGYDTPVGERGDTLSGGQRQRLAIARALLRDPAILLLDEVTSALDARAEAAIHQTLSRAVRGRTLILATHRLKAVTDMDEILMMSAGRLVERGTHVELLAHRGPYAAMWAEQATDPDGGGSSAAL